MSADQAEAMNEKLIKYFNIPNPNIGFCAGGLRRIAIDPTDDRARKMIAARGPRYFSRQQVFIYACAKYLGCDLYLDIGSNFGECLFALPLYFPGRVVGYEPIRHIIPFLEKSKTYNDDLSDLHISTLAIGSGPDSEADFYVDTKWSGTSGRIRNRDPKRYKRHTVQGSSIDEQLRQMNEPKCLLVKVDVEGHEPAVFAGARGEQILA